MIIIGEKLNGTIPSVGEAIKSRDEAFLRSLAKRQAEAGVDYIDVSASTSAELELETIKWIIGLVQEETDTPICVDSPDPRVCVNCLPLCKRPGLLNSISLEGDKAEIIFPAIANSAWNCVALLCDSDGIPQTTEKRLEIADRIIGKAGEYGINPARLFIDPLVLSVSSVSDSVVTFCQTTETLLKKYPELHITSGLSNISYGLPLRKKINQAFLTMAMTSGMDSAILDPLNKDVMSTIYITDALLAKDRLCRKFLGAYRKGLIGEPTKIIQEQFFMKNRLCEALGIKKPVIQGPMAWVSTAPLVAAVSNAGGLGVLGVGFAPAEFIRQQVEATRELTAKPFGINTIMIPDNLKHLTELIRDLKPPVVYADTIAGLDIDLCRKHFDTWHNAGCKVIVKASFIQDALIAEAAGAEVIIVKGWEGGGHVTFEATIVLVPQAADQLHVPVVASGGIAEGRGMAACIALGADGIEMGTVFLAASEGTVHPNVAQAIVRAGDMSTVITGYATDEPCRQIDNRLARELVRIEATHVKTEAAELLRTTAESSLKKAMLEGDMEDGAVMAGQIAALIKDIHPAGVIIDTVLSEAKNVLSSLKAYSFE